MADPMDASARSAPSIGRRQLVLVDGRTFAISDEAGQMWASTHGMIHDDRRHIASFELDVVDAHVEVLAASCPTPLSAVIVGEVTGEDDSSRRAVLIRRRWIAGGLREDVHLHNTTPTAQRWQITLRVQTDFAHVFDVKAGKAGQALTPVGEHGHWIIRKPDDSIATHLCFDPPPTTFDSASGTATWTVHVAPRTDSVLTITAEPVVDHIAAGLAFPVGLLPTDAIPMRRLDAWRSNVPSVVSTDPRLAHAVEQALADIAALRIIDSAHLDRVVVAAGAPWFMTLFGRDSLLTSWMTLPFDPTLTIGVLDTLAELQGTRDDPVAEEEPGKILHELRRRGAGGPFATRGRYYGTVDATPLFVMLAAEADRWGALDDDQLRRLAPAVDAAIRWVSRSCDADVNGLLTYERSDPSGLSNQGWKDSWDGVTFADGSIAKGRIALAEVQGYAYAALVGAAALSSRMTLTVRADELLERAESLRSAFNGRFWDERGWFVMALDGTGRRVDALTTNPGHALWTGIADEQRAVEFIDRLADPAMWSGWGLRTLADTMGAYDPLSYHNGSVWPHDTAICAAGAARYGRWDLVDRMVHGALDATVEFDGRPPELFSGIARSEAPMPVSYPASCSPQAWSSASILLHVRTMLDLGPSPVGRELHVGRVDCSTLPDVRIERVAYMGRRFDVEIVGGSSTIRPTR